ncbi:MAG: lipoate--protein ligase family protein [Candidatus Sericytochromatia bacterium]|uniref:Lipoate--protein ligase family protein n=1 Tax=Candidatus Tanganyikabacteria bacterium TaxID=2961651 RepID=A0A938BMP5_9BACT|nr:lipoate--protein ligase family protein [Candidatus Tanganyikabacteria bacterium]
MKVTILGIVRLIDDGAARGSWNMAVDAALLAALCDGIAVPTLRFYEWEPAALSLGYSQRTEDLDFSACLRQGIEVVRRPTGGRAVLHAAELTYAVTMPIGGESVAESYCKISKAIARAISRALSGAGVEILLAPGTRSQSRAADCFAVATQADLLADGRKIVGSAQVRRRGALLQHGSIKVGAPPVPIGTLLGASGSALESGVNSLEGLLPESPEGFVPRLKRLIAEELGVAWHPEELTRRERDLALALAHPPIEAGSSSGLRRFDRPGRPLPARD